MDKKDTSWINIGITHLTSQDKRTKSKILKDLYKYVIY